MRKAITILFVVYSLSGFAKGFLSYDSTRYSIASGFNFSTSHLKRDFANTPHPGFDLKFQLFLTNSIRTSLEYSHLFKHNLGGEWQAVSANVFELNFQYVASVNDYNAGFYIISGLAIQNWKGAYIGMDPENQYRQFGDSPENYFITKWPTLALGVGVQRTVKKIELYAEFKYRVAKKEENIPLKIVDVSHSIGLRYNIRPQNKKILRKSPFKLPGERYHWF